MMHLDTNFLIVALVPGTPQDVRVSRWLTSGESLAMSAVGWAEFLCGPISDRLLELANRIVTERVPLLEEDSAIAAKLFNAGGRRRGSLPDCLIAATAIRVGAALATTDLPDFRRFESSGLQLTD
jgi:predicted nucleic acid-binding protein